MEIISLKDAKEKGLPTYYTGKPCKYGHVSERQVSNRRCRECAYNIQRESRREEKAERKKIPYESRPGRKLLHGVGINDADYKISNIDGEGKFCPYYNTWSGMLRRCYSADTYKTYSECRTIDAWHRFSNFKKWMEKQNWEGCDLDKDILYKNNKLYSPETCAFVSPSVNRFLIQCGSEGSTKSLGTYWNKRKKKYTSCCSNPFSGKVEYLGEYHYQWEAHEAWRKRKHELACMYADLETDPRIVQALRTRFAK